MKKLYQFLSSIKPTIILTYLIVFNAVIGSLIILYSSKAFEKIDKTILIEWLISNRPAVSWWILSLIVLICFFTINTLLCTYDRLTSLVRARRGSGIRFNREESTLLTEDIDRGRGVRLRVFLPYIAHLGFIIAVAGHLTGSLWGFKGDDIFAAQGETVQIKESGKLSLKIGDLSMRYSEQGYPDELKGNVVLLSEGKVIKERIVEINRPLIYRNTAVYIKNVQTVPRGLIVRKRGSGREERLFLGRGSSVSLNGSDLKIAGGRVDQRTGAMEVLGFNGNSLIMRTWLSPFDEAMRSFNLGEYNIEAEKFSLINIGTFAVNNNPGVWILFAGLAIFMAALTGHLVLRQMK